MNITQSKGNSLELKCITKFIELGYLCSIPYGNSALYDFIVDINGKLLRILCKNAMHSYLSASHTRDKGSFLIPTARQTTNTKRTIRYTYSETEIDYFMTLFLDNFYLIPVSECNYAKILRLSPPKTNIKFYNKAEDYLLENILQKLM